jgi:hypothetical protein
LPPPVDPKHTADLDAELLEVFVSQKVDPDGGLVP